MNRRQFLAAVGSAALVSPALAGQAPGAFGRLRHVGVYSTSPRLADLRKYYIGPFLEGMRRLGWTEGVNVAYDFVLNERAVALPQYYALMRDHARDLVARKPDVIWVDSSISTSLILGQTSSIPVVGSAVSSTIGRRWAESHTRPGKNFTGVSNAEAWQLGEKRLEFLLELMPKIRRVGLLTYREDGSFLDQKLPRLRRENEPGWRDVDRQALAWVREEIGIRALAERHGATLAAVVMDREDQARAAFELLGREQVQAVLIAHHPLFQNHRKLVLELAKDRRIPAVGHRTYFVEDGALLSYATRLDEQMRRSANHVHRILKGSAPGEVAIEVFSEVELWINEKVAGEFGLRIPSTLRGREKYTCIFPPACPPWTRRSG